MTPPSLLAGLRHGLAMLSTAVLLGASACAPGEPASGSEVSVAVAANFAQAHDELARRFESAIGVRVLSSTGATGQLYAQIRNGAPFEVFLAADGLRPRLLEEEGLAVPGTRFTYAVGRLVLYAPGFDSVRSGGADLAEGDFTNLAIANPRTAPYGEAAKAVLSRLGLAEALGPRIVRGESVSQAYQFVRSGAAELGFVALSQVVGEPPDRYWLVPADQHETLIQDAVLLRAGEDNPLARRYWEFLRSPEAQSVIESFGYDPADS